MPRNPYFSIVTPVYNREREIRQAIDSCLAQDFGDYEVIVVDDASTDNTPAVVASYLDPRVRLIRHPRNRGAGPARNSAIRVSSGRWIVYLDSDDELLSECLSRIFEVVSRDADHIGRFGFLYNIDKGGVSPSLLPPNGVLGYEDWLRFAESARWSDALWVTRRDTFDRCMMPEGRGPEFKYNLDFSRCFPWRIVPEVVALLHTDSPVRLSLFQRSQDPEREWQREMDRLEHWNLVLAEHGPALRQLAPGRYQGTLRSRAVSLVLTGRKLRGFLACLGCVCHYPWTLANWLALASTLLGRRATRWMRTVRARWNSFAAPEHRAGPPRASVRWPAEREGMGMPKGQSICGL